MFFFKKMPEIKTNQLAEKLSERPVIIDVREKNEFVQGHIPGAKNVPLNKLSGYKATQEPVYVICQSGMRSKRGTKLLIDKGIHAINVSGGMNRWQGKTKGGKV